MTIFDKLSGLAQKAKENAVARAILAKDKRLDKPMSEGIQASHIGLLKMSTYGVPGTVTAVAFDPVSSLLAVAGGSDSDTFVRVFGKGISSELVLNNPTRIKYLQFKIGHPTLVVVDRNNAISTYDLRTKRVCHVINTPSIITSLEYCAGTDWLFVGFADGNIDVFDIGTGKFSEDYGIPDLFLDETSQPNEPSRSSGGLVVAIQMHPSDLNTVLIGYESAVFLWNIREQTVKKAFIIQRNQQQQPSHLTCLAWSPCGSRFMAGYDDGYMRLWDVRLDHRPTLSRRAFQAMPSSSPNGDPCEPIYRMVWYLDEASRKSFLVVAGGSDLPDIRGLHIMEFDMENDPRDARRQTILSTDVDISDFILLSRDMYFLGARSPLGLLVVGCDGAIRAYSLGHGYPVLTLPSALQFLDPPIKKAYQYSHLNEATFQRIISVDQNHAPRVYYLPLTGGVAGDKHVYRFNSNDLLITVHANNLIRFWDASFTSLRPLTFLTLDCADQIKDHKGNIKHVEFDRISGTVFVALDNNTILLYAHQLPVTQVPVANRTPPQQLSVHESVIDKCDDTLNEISDLLKEMEADPTEDGDVAGTATTNPPEEQLAGEKAVSENIPTETLVEPITESPKTGRQSTATEGESVNPKELEAVHDPRIESARTGLNIEMLDVDPNAFGYRLKMKITLDKCSAKHLVAGGADLLAISTTSEKVFVIDTVLGKVVYTTDLQVEADNTKADGKTGETHSEETQVKPAEEVANAVITSIHLYRSYASTDYSHATHQLYIGLDNGIVYQHDLKLTSSAPTLIIPPISPNPVVNIHLVNLDGHLQTILPTEADPHYSPPIESDETDKKDSQSLHRKSQDSKDSSSSTVKEEDASSNKSEKPSLLRKATRKLSRSGGRPSKDNAPPPLPTAVMTDDPGEILSSNPSTPPKRTQPSKWEYHPQADPHYIFVVSAKSVACVLAGYNVRLFSMDIHDTEGCNDNDIIIHSQIMSVKDAGTCLAVVLQTGAVVIYTLPNLLPIARVSLPAELAEGHLLSNMSLSGDGRLLTWTGLCELEQYLLLLQNNIQCGEDVILFDPRIKIPPHPASGPTTQKPKKTWLESVQGAFQKGPLTVGELNTLMGRKQSAVEETPSAKAAAKIAEYNQNKKANADSSTSGGSMLGGVFQELGQRMDERGERINELQNKFEDMNAASGDFLKAVREYNERQANKKWWEF